MKTTVRSIIDVSANAHGWSSGNAGRERYEKDGYEVYFFSQHDGFELTFRNPETMERETVLEVRDDDLCVTSPAYVALLEHVLKEAESIVANQSEEGT